MHNYCILVMLLLTLSIPSLPYSFSSIRLAFSCKKSGSVKTIQTRLVVAALTWAATCSEIYTNLNWQMTSWSSMYMYMWYLCVLDQLYLMDHTQNDFQNPSNNSHITQLSCSLVYPYLRLKKWAYDTNILPPMIQCLLIVTCTLERAMSRV